MPFIPQFRRHIVALEGAANTGELCYQLYDTCLTYTRKHGDSFGRYAEVLGALKAAEHEFYRLYVAPYEDKKRLDNGDV